MKKIVFNMLILILVVSINLAVSQTKSPLASFITESHDFGRINESDGPATFKFEFTNVGGSPLIISNVQASCGCTTPSWPKEPILPGAKNSIVVSFNPSGRPGRFDKSITVTSNGEPATQVLKILGDVSPKQLTVQDLYPAEINGLRMKASQITFNNIVPNAVATQSMEVYNDTAKLLKVAFKNVPKHIKIKITPEQLPAKTKAIIEVTYDAKVKADWGFVFDAIDISLNDKVNPNARITVTANIQEDFTKLTEAQKQGAAKIEFENATFDFGTIKQGEKAKYDYIYKNVGKSDLIIRKIAPGCGCTIAESKNLIVKPGEKGTISSEFNSSGRSGSQSKAITVISNDPSNPKAIIWIKGIIE